MYRFRKYSLLFFQQFCFNSYYYIHQLTITDEYLRSIELEYYPFLCISSLVFDSYDQQLLIVDSFNSIIHSVDLDSDEQNVETLLKHSENFNCPQGLYVGIECSVCDNATCT